MKPLVMVTGGAGFFGSHLCDRLLEMGHEVLAVDDLSTGHRKHVAHLADHPRFRIALHDVARSLPKEAHDARWIFNLACPASPVHYEKAPVQTALTSVLGTWHVLELAARTGARVLQVSTSAVYGDPEVRPQAESYWGRVNPLGPRACYVEGKRCAETLCTAYRSERNVDIRIARLFNTYGPRLRPADGRVVSNFIAQALRGEPLTVYGDGSQTRSFCYCTDLIDGIFKLSQSDFHEPVNIGNPREMTIKQFAEEIIRLTETTAKIDYRPLPVDDPKVRRPDISRARKVLGWEPRVEFEDGIRQTIEFFRTRLK
jgi:UDP-glucuronate decarboxylase